MMSHYGRFKNILLNITVLRTREYSDDGLSESYLPFL